MKKRAVLSINEHASRLAANGATRYRANLAYDGTDFKGWQTQPEQRTVQGAIERRLTAMLDAPIVVAGSGRTDAGVHARAQCFHFDVPPPTDRRRFPPPGLSDDETAEALGRVLCSSNSGLPEGIRVLDIRVAPPGFHARESCTGKRYVYTLEEGAGSPFTSRYRWALGRGVSLDVEAMREGAALLVGVCDFSAFALDTDPRPRVKCMRRLDVERLPPDESGGGPRVTIVAECNRFLQYMMRSVSGTLVQVGLGKLSVDSLHDLIEKGRRLGGCPSTYRAPARGLCLDHVFYDDKPWITYDV